jgi:hypothetical protein
MVSFVAEGTVRLPLDSTGKYLRTQTVTVGAQSEEQQVVTLGDAAGHVAALSAAGGQYTQLTSASTIGQVAQVNPYGALKIQPPPQLWFSDTFNNLDTVNRWVTGGTIAPIAANGAVFSPGTTANASSTLSSIPQFTTGTAYVSVVTPVALETVAVTGAHRWFGLGTAPASPSATNPVQDGLGWEVDTAGALRASMYQNGGRVWTSILTYPSDGQPHLYQMEWSASGVLYYVDGTEVPVIWAPPAMTGVSMLPIRTAQYNGATTLSAPTTFMLRAAGISDSMGPTTMIADATYPWRRTSVSANGVLSAGMPDATSSGSILMTTTGGAVTATSSGVGVVGVQVAGTWTGTIALEATTDGVNWFGVNGVQSGTGAIAGVITGNGQWRVNSAGYAQVRIRSSIAGTGSATATLIAAAPASVITAAEPVQVRGYAIATNTSTMTTTGTYGPVDVSAAGNVTITASGGFAGTIAGVIEQTNDGSTWYPAGGVRSDTGLAESTWTLAAGSVRMWDLGCEGITAVRIRLTTAPTSSSVVFRANAGGMSFSPSVAATLQDPPRVGLTWYTTGFAVPTAEAMATVTGLQRLGSAVVTTALTVSAGKTLRVQAISGSITLVGTTAVQTRITLRAAAGAAAAATSQVYWTVRKGASALTAGTVYDFDTSFAGGLEFPAGYGIGFSALAGTALMHSLDLSMVGYEY